MCSIDEIKTWLQNLPSREHCKGDEFAAVLAGFKADAVAKNDEEAAKDLWCLEQTLHSQRLYLEAFDLLKQGAFYDAWCKLEQTELALMFLGRHFRPSFAKYRLDFIETHVKQWQQLYPYKIFMSPEIVEEEKTCNICKTPISIRNPCGHIVGEIYGGEQCCRIVSKMQFLGMAMVENPVQKYSVPFIIDPKTGESKDHYDYSIVRFAAERLRSPTDGWGFVWTKKRHPHSRFPHVGRNDRCPCESGKKYKKCCLQENGVLRPHVEITFDKLPPQGLPNEEFSR